MSKYVLTKEDITKVLKSAFEAGWYGSRDLEESIVNELILSLQDKIKTETTPVNYEYLGGFGADLSSTTTNIGMWTTANM